ncbi:MAG: hypothetical protein HY360_18370 [Verrucomicrobia bacterium]|nr:hypothetical protein [Verrucomicrobiota bacterium]
MKALREAVAEVVDEHRREGRPLAEWCDGKAVWVSPHEKGVVHESTDWKEAETAVRAYGKARKVFCDAQARLAASGLLSGNDNKVGVAGEFWAKIFYHQEGWKLTSIEPSNNAGFDFRCQRNESEIKVSVKAISDESTSGKQVPLRPNSDWDELLVILLTSELIPYRYGRASRQQFECAHKKSAIGSKPTVSRFWLGKKGWLKKYGTVDDWKTMLPSPPSSPSALS